MRLDSRDTCRICRAGAGTGRAGRAPDGHPNGAGAVALVDRLWDAHAEADPSARFRLFDEVIDVLRAASADGLLIVPDDLHCSDGFLPLGQS